MLFPTTYELTQQTRLLDPNDPLDAEQTAFPVPPIIIEQDEQVIKLLLPPPINEWFELHIRFVSPAVTVDATTLDTDVLAMMQLHLPPKIAEHLTLHVDV